jgi:SAM-dependent methyltransferase
MGIAERVSAFNRKRKWECFVSEFPISPSARTLDVGFTEKEYSSVDNFIERNYPYPEMLTGLGIDDPIQFSSRYPKVKAIRYDGKTFPFDDRSFDICWSNAVIEHVGGFDRQVEFLKEIRRVSKSFYITTPNRHFPIEVHTRIPFLHWLPKPLFDSILPLFNKQWASGDYMHLLTLFDIWKVLKAAGIEHYQVRANRIFGLTLDFVIISKS